MKNRHNLWMFAAAVVLWTGCTKEPTATPAGGYELTLLPTVEEGTQDTRLTLDGVEYRWQEGDQIGVYVSNALQPTQNAPGRYDGGAEGFSVRVGAATAGDGVWAYWPYASDAEYTTDRIWLPIAGLQVQPQMGVFNGTQMPMVTRAAQLDGAGNGVTLQFVPMASVACFKVWSSLPNYRSERVRSVTLTAEQPLSGKIGVACAAADPAATAPMLHRLTGKSITTSLSRASTPGASKADAEQVYMVVPAQQSDGQLKVRVITSAAIYDFSAAGGVNFARNAVKGFSLDLGSEMAERTLLENNWPFTVAILDAMNTQDHRYGMIPGSALLDLIGYEITLIDPSVVRYWVHYDAPSVMRAYSSSTTDAALRELVQSKGTLCTGNRVVDLTIDERYGAAVAVVCEDVSGNLQLYRTNFIRSNRGSARTTSWINM